MGTGVNVRDNEGKWVFISPVANLYLREAVAGEIRVDRVLFLNAKKLPRVRRRLQIPFPMSKWRHVCEENFKNAPSLAIIHHTGKPRQLLDECLRIVRDESLILTASQLAYARRCKLLGAWACTERSLCRGLTIFS